VKSLPLITTVGCNVLLQNLRSLEECDLSDCSSIDDHPFELWSKTEEPHFLPPSTINQKSKAYQKAMNILAKAKKKQKRRSNMKEMNLPSKSLTNLNVSGMHLLTVKGMNAISSRTGMRKITCLSKKMNAQNKNKKTSLKLKKSSMRKVSSCCNSSTLRMLSRCNSLTLQILELEGYFDESGMLSLSSCHQLVTLTLTSSQTTSQTSSQQMSNMTTSSVSR
jgi:hypothetical protein